MINEYDKIYNEYGDVVENAQDNVERQCNRLAILVMSSDIVKGNDLTYPEQYEYEFDNLIDYCLKYYILEHDNDEEEIFKEIKKIIDKNITLLKGE